MRRVRALSGGDTITLDGLDENYRGLACYREGFCIRRIDFLRILTTPLDLANFLIRECIHHALEGRIAFHPVFTLNLARKYRVALIVAIQALIHAFLEYTLVVLRQQAIPATAPDHLDHFPVGTAKRALQLLDDLAVATHRTIQPLQIAVHDDDEIIEFFATGHVDGAKHFRLVGLTITNETPHFCMGAWLESSILQILGESGLIDCCRC
jgi:hypothetical protein